MNDAPFIPAWLDDRGLDPIAFRVLCHLWRRRNTKTGACYPAAEAIRKACGIDRKTTFKAIARLEKAELLTRTKTTFRGSNHYDLRVPIVPPNGTIGEPQPSHQTVRQSSPQVVRQSSPETVRQGSPSEGSPSEVCEGAEPPPQAHTQHPSWFAEVAAAHPSKDADACWKDYLEWCEDRRRKPTKRRFGRWLSSEKELLKTGKPSRAVPHDGPPGWRETLAEKHPGNEITKENKPWSAVPREIVLSLFNGWYFDSGSKQWRAQKTLTLI